MSKSLLFQCIQTKSCWVFCVFEWASFSLRLFELDSPDMPSCVLSPPLTNSVKADYPSLSQITTTFSVCQTATSVSSYHWEWQQSCYSKRRPLGNVEIINENEDCRWHETTSALQRNPWPDIKSFKNKTMMIFTTSNNLNHAQRLLHNLQCFTVVYDTQASNPICAVVMAHPSYTNYLNC